MSQDIVLKYITANSLILQSDLKKLLKKEGYNTSCLSSEVAALRSKNAIDRIPAPEQQSWWLFPL